MKRQQQQHQNNKTLKRQKDKTKTKAFLSSQTLSIETFSHRLSNSSEENKATEFKADHDCV